MGSKPSTVKSNPQAFFQGRAKYSEGGAKTYYLPENTRSAGAGEDDPPIALPCGRPFQMEVEEHNEN
jgi:hypothetical protein